MMLDGLIGLVAPHVCVSCGQEGSILCKWCCPGALQLIPSRCFMCHTLTVESATCSLCRPKSKLKHVWVVTKLEGPARELLERLKFKKAKLGATIIAQLMNENLPHYSGFIVTHLPTASSRKRQRGYDQSALIAKHFSACRELPYESLLLRTGYSRQIGSSKKERWRQLENAFLPRNIKKIRGRDILLIDDVVTTGASISAAAKTLKQSGARSVRATIFAQKM